MFIQNNFDKTQCHDVGRLCVFANCTYIKGKWEHINYSFTRSRNSLKSTLLKPTCSCP